MTSSKQVRTLEESIRETKALVSMYRDLIENGETRERALEAEIGCEIEKLQGNLRFLRNARVKAPDGLERARVTLARLEVQQRANATQGYSGPSRATLARKADRAESLKAKVLAMAAKLRAQGVDPVALLNQEGGCDA